LRLPTLRNAVAMNLHQALLVQQLVDIPDLLRDDLIEDHASGRCLHHLPVDPDLDARVEPHLAVVMGDDHFRRGREQESAPHVGGPRLRQ